ncbi:MAG TPA: hypothetical protein VMU51_29215 [Mycobacteriales bacterium]|nr:hypothetical protein [Mycobacteriales bacterium]
MSRRPSLPGAAELFRATGVGPAPAEHPPARDPERNGQRLRAADAEAHPAPASAALAAPAVERTASVTPLPPAPDPVALAPAPAPRSVERPVEREHRPAPAEPLSRSAGPFEDDPAGRNGRTNGVRQTRRQRMRTVGDRRPSGRERHEEKITVYCSAEELLDLETARLTLRGEHGLVVDRGRIVREAVAIILADLDAKGEDSILVRRFRES